MPRRTFARRQTRAIGTVAASLLVVVALVAVGLGTYALMGGFSTSPSTACAPAESPVCSPSSNLNDLTMLFPFQSVQQNAKVPFTVNVPAGESPTSFTYYWGDNSSFASPNARTASHNFTTAGIYLVEVDAQVAGRTHTSLAALQQVKVTTSFASSSAASLPNVVGSIVSNSTSGSGGMAPTAVLQPGQSVSVEASYISNPSNPVFLPMAPSFKITSGGTTGVSLTSNTSAVGGSATGTFGAPGTYDLTFVGGATSGSTTIYQNYSFTVKVSPVGTHAGIARHPLLHSPHPGSLIYYELAPGGSASEDPAIDYETLGAEPIYNVYQSLITYNGSQTGPDPTNFVPVLATCVPGSDQCKSLYPANNGLVNGWNYTFVIQRNASFYDPSTGGSWGVYPSDVLFSYARTLGFSTLPCVACNPGWIQAQALLNAGNITWNSIHSSYNNTPGNVLGSMLVNDTNFCPASAMQNDHGCITFVAYGAHHVWPYFLELVADPLGGAVVPCGWFSAPAQGAGIPYWTSGNVSGSGDHPCQVPGVGGYGLAPGQIPVTGWDHWEELGSGSFGTFQGHVQFNMVGSGPYYLSELLQATSYTLKASPAYSQNPYCTWKQCPPTATNYAREVSVFWETSQVPGEQAYQSGIADAASIPGTDNSLLIQLISTGQVGAITAPDLTIGFQPFDLNFNLDNVARFSTAPVTIKSDWFSYLGMRQFFIHAYPYSTVQNSITTRNGIQFGFPYGGAIPQYMANYYPTNIPWPSSDPCTDPSNSSCATYWWQQMQNPASPYYDPEVAGCNSGSPCEFPVFGTTGSPDQDEVLLLWATQVSQLSGGAIKMDRVDITFLQTIINSEFSNAGQNPMPLYGLGWAPDYPDPTDYVVPLLYPNGTYTQGNAVIQSLLVSQYTSGCAGHNASDWNYFANTTFPQSCQGIAYKAMINLFGKAAITPSGPFRVMLYDLAEKILYQLGLYVYTTQGNEIASFAAWIDSSSINTNVTIGGGGDTPFFWITGNGVQYPGST